MTKTQLKILLIIPNLGRGGAQQIFRQQLELLSVHFEVLGCVFNWDGAFKDDCESNIISLDVPGGKTYWSKGWYFFLRIKRLRRLKKEMKIDVSISHLEGADYVNLLSKGKDRTICWIHGTKIYDENISGLLGKIRMHVLMPWLYRKANKIVTVSKGITKELSKHINGLDKHLQTIYNGFEVDKIMLLGNEPLANEFSSLFNQAKIIITHCRLSRQKNLEALLTIFRELKNKIEIKLVIIGDGELRENLILLCADLKLKSWACWDNNQMDSNYDVYFIGQQSNPFKYLQKAILYALPSGWEGFPLALCEAMVCRLTVIAADCFTGPREILAPELCAEQPLQKPYVNENGVLMPLADVSDKNTITIWVKAIDELLSGKHDTSINKSVAFQRVRQFQLSESISQTINLVQEISK